MAQRSILSMFKKSNDRLGNPVKDKIRLGQPESVKIRSESRTGNPTLADNNRLGQPENYAENQSESRGQPEITEMLSETRLGNPTQTGDQELIESESRSSDLMEFPSDNIKQHIRNTQWKENNLRKPKKYNNMVHFVFFFFFFFP